MKNFILLSEFFGGIILFGGIAWLIGYLLKTDEYYKEFQKQKTNRRKDDNN